MRYFEDFVRPAKVYRPADPREAAALADLRDRLGEWDGPAEPEALQNMVFEVGKAHGFEPLRAWFAAIYEVLLGAAQGPRFGGFIAVYGVPETIALIDHGGPFPYPQDGDTFRNDEGLLPDQPTGYYREYTVETPGSDDRGARRIVAGSAGELCWTDDHYNSFSRITR